MKICVLGAGYVGLVSASCFAELGHEVVGIDVDSEKITKLKQGISPIYEPGLEEILKRNLAASRLNFSQSLSKGLQGAQVVLCAVGTPPDEQRRVDLRFVRQVADQVGAHMTDYLVFVDKSTVPVGTAESVKNIISQNLKQAIDFDVASNPEFLREGSAVTDFLEPDRIIIGVDSERAKNVLSELYRPLVERGAKFMITDVKSAEMIKYASNSFLATKISFINEVANLCDAVGADVMEVAKGMGLDSRIGSKFLEAGPGYGGSCFPKDVDEFVHTAQDGGIEMRILEAVVQANKFQRAIVIQKLQKHLADLNGKTIAIWGLSFKPETDDMREAASLDIIKSLIQKGARINAYDPLATNNILKSLGLTEESSELKLCADKFSALTNSDALILMTHWSEFREITIESLAGKVPVIIDTRNIWSRSAAQAAGLLYEGMGR